MNFIPAYDCRNLPVEGTRDLGAYELVSAGVNSVVVDDPNAPVEYYNLQGVRVANPANGIFIRRQGSKATKVIL